MKRIIYLLTTALCFTFIMYSSLFATSARMYGLGLRDSDSIDSTLFNQTINRAYNFDWMIQLDDEYIHTNPAYIPQIQEFIFINTNQTSSNIGSGGALFKFYDSFGIMLSTGNPVDAQFVKDTNNAELTKDQFNFKTGLKLGIFSMGWSLSYSQTKDRDTSNDSETFRSYLYNKFGFYFNFGPNIDLDFSLYVALPYAKEIAGDEAVYESDGAFDFGLNARVNIGITKRQRLHIFMAYDNQNHSALAYDPALDMVTAYKASNVAFTFGVSDEVKLSKTSFAFLGIAYTGSGDNVATSDANTSYPANSYDRDTLTLVLGAESKLTDNLTIRFGANRRLYHFIDDDKYSNNNPETTFDNDTTTNVESATKIFIGLTLELKDFKVDWVINNSLFTDGPYFISGNNNGFGHNNVETSFSLSYKFDSTSLFSDVEDPKKDATKDPNTVHKGRR